MNNVQTRPVRLLIVLHHLEPPDFDYDYDYDYEHRFAEHED